MLLHFSQTRVTELKVSERDQDRHSENESSHCKLIPLCFMSISYETLRVRMLIKHLCLLSTDLKRATISANKK